MLAGVGYRVVSAAVGSEYGLQGGVYRVHIGVYVVGGRGDPVLVFLSDSPMQVERNHGLEQWRSVRAHVRGGGGGGGGEGSTSQTQESDSP
jgi:hypothetical protein